MFNVGDLIIGRPEAGFAITTEKCLLKVESYQSDGTFTAKMIAHKSAAYKEYVGDTYDNLSDGDFKLATDEEINNIKGIKPTKGKAEKIIHLGNLIAKFYPTSIESNFNPTRTMQVETELPRIDALRKIRDTFTDQKSIYDFKGKVDLSVFDDILNDKIRKEALKNLINFFIEFQFQPNFRFVNTLALKLQESIDAGKEYICNYFTLANSPYVTAVSDKMKSPEFGAILAALSMIGPTKQINKRLKIYAGFQGTGKTTMALNESDGRCIVCNNAILPQDLIEDFKFDDGKPGFNKSILCQCMEKGKSITLDEFNLLPFESIRFLQGLLDDKKEFVWKGETIHIKEGFQIITTMNLVVNGMTFGLPEPLIDRAYELKNFELTADQLMSALE